jgi:hypothetical protein
MGRTSEIVELELRLRISDSSDIELANQFRFYKIDTAIAIDF